MTMEGSSYLPNFASPRMHMHVILNVSVAFAFYALVCFYHTVESDLTWCDPWPKFVAIKMVVFVTFWQQAALNVMNAAGVVDEESSRAAQDLLVCIEMLVASLAFYYVFPYQEWAPGYKKKKQDFLIMESLALSDFVSDIRGVIGRNAYKDVKVNAVSEDVDVGSSHCDGLPSMPSSGRLAGMFSHIVGFGSTEKRKLKTDDDERVPSANSGCSSSNSNSSYNKLNDNDNINANPNVRPSLKDRPGTSGTVKAR